MPGVHEVHETLASFGVLDAGTGRRAQRIVALGVSIGALVGVAVVTGIVIATIPRAAAEKAYWTISGPPCPVATPAEIHKIGRPLAQVTEFGEGHFARISGAVLCNDLTDRFGMVVATACQFNAPRALWVSSEGGSGYYDFAGGGPATVTVSRTRPPRCVRASRFNGD
jgi:hypothetical protein